MLNGGPKLYKKIKRIRNKLNREENLKEAAEVKAWTDRRVPTIGCKHNKQRKYTKSKSAAKKSRVHDRLMQVVAPPITTWAAESDSLLVPETCAACLGAGRDKRESSAGGCAEIYVRRRS